MQGSVEAVYLQKTIFIKVSYNLTDTLADLKFIIFLSEYVACLLNSWFALMGSNLKGYYKIFCVSLS